MEDGAITLTAVKIAGAAVLEEATSNIWRRKQSIDFVPMCALPTNIYGTLPLPHQI